MSNPVFYKNPITIIAGLSFITVIGFYFVIFSNGLSSKQSEWANFGAYAGGTLGALFAFMSFIILLNAFNLQKEELSTAISALSKSADSNEKQVKNIEAQKFETTFYALLTLHNSTLQELRLDTERIHSHLANFTVMDIFENENKNSSDYLKSRQDSILGDIELSQYFRILYQILKFVARNNVQNKNKDFKTVYLNNKKTLNNDEKMYASIIRGFVPVKLLPVLALNCIPRYDGLYDFEEYWSLLERYEFLEHLRLDDLKDDLNSFSILDSYSYALGSNSGIQDKVNRINAKYSKKIEHELTKGCYLDVYYKSRPVPKPKFRCKSA